MCIVSAQIINIGVWRFYPEAMAAMNMHNGTVAQCLRTADGGWQIRCASCPADWMLKELAEWFSKWIVGC